MGEQPDSWRPEFVSEEKPEPVHEVKPESRHSSPESVHKLQLSQKDSDSESDKEEAVPEAQVPELQERLASTPPPSPAAGKVDEGTEKGADTSLAEAAELAQHEKEEDEIPLVEESTTTTAKSSTASSK